MKQIKMLDSFTYQMDASNDRTLPAGLVFTVPDKIADEAVAAGSAEVIGSDDDEAFVDVSAPAAKAKGKAAAGEDAPAA